MNERLQPKNADCAKTSCLSAEEEQQTTANCKSKPMTTETSQKFMEPNRIQISDFDDGVGAQASVSLDNPRKIYLEGNSKRKPDKKGTSAATFMIPRQSQCLKQVRESVLFIQDTVLQDQSIKQTNTAGTSNCKNESQDQNIVKRPYACSSCGKCYTRKQYLTRHQRNHHPGEAVLTDRTRGASVSKNKRFRDKRTPSCEKPHQCPVCEKAFQFPSKLKRHSLIHTGEKPFKCADCEQSFTRKYQLKSHVSNIHLKVKFPCHICKKPFSAKSSLQMHISTIHLKTNIFECEICKQKFYRNSHLQDHMLRFHSELKLYECEICWKKFSTQKGLYNHRRVHTGEKPYECEVCYRKFACISNLKVHRKKCPPFK